MARVVTMQHYKWNKKDRVLNIQSYSMKPSGSLHMEACLYLYVGESPAGGRMLCTQFTGSLQSTAMEQLPQLWGISRDGRLAMASSGEDVHNLAS